VILPDYTMGGKIPKEMVRDAYYGHNPQDYIRTDCPMRDAIDFCRFFGYYRDLFAS
jgi:hypothetical protein